MAQTVFWSWQSDKPTRETRSLIRDALVAALDRISVDLEEADRPELDHDTRGVPGSPDIVATILAKIESAGVFVGDVTPIAISETGKQVGNPNVLIELGYAKRAIGPERVILVWNTAFTQPRPEDLPFDMRHRRGPISYALSEGADREELRRVRAALSTTLEERLRSCLSFIPAATPPPAPWHARDETDPSIWHGGSEPLVVNRGHLEGSVRIAMESHPRGYARLLPSGGNAPQEALSILDHNTTHPVPLGRYSGLNWGPTRGGFLAYRSSAAIEESGVTPTATRWFRDTGEFWGVASSFFSEHDGTYSLATGYAVKRWISWLEHTLSVSRAVGGIGPFHIELGLDGLAGTLWPRRGWGRDVEIEAVENRVSHDGLVTEGTEEEILRLVEGAFVKVANAYGLQRFSSAQFKELCNGY